MKISLIRIFSSNNVFDKHQRGKSNSEKNNGRFSGINEDDFDSEKGVALALDNDSAKRVIVKAIFPRKKSELENARREAQTLAQLDHQNVVKFIDFLENEKPEWVLGHVCFLITEFCSGGTLVEFIQKKKEAGQRTRADEARIIAAQMISALSFCHEQKPAIVHQDIKPANVFVMNDFITIKLGDFGSAATISSVMKSITATGVRYTRQYGAPEMFNNETVKKSAQLDVWGFALVLQEVLTLEHAFGRVQGQPAMITQIQVNIQGHENPISTRTRLVHVFGQAHEFAEFEALLEKCTRADRNQRPKNAIELRNEDVFSDFRQRLENGEKACDIVQPPFEDQKDTQIRELKEELAEERRKVADLENRLNSEATSMRQKDEIIETQNQENSQLIKEIEKLENELEKMKPTFAKMESELKEAKNLIQQLKTKHESERNKLRNETRKAEEIERKNNELEKMRNELAKSMRNELGELGGAGHFWGNDKIKLIGGKIEGKRDMMREAELKKVLRLLATGEKRINLKFDPRQNLNVAEAGWTLQFRIGRGGNEKWYYVLWLDQKAGRAKFKATAQQINEYSGEESNRRELQSETDGTRQRILYEQDDSRNHLVRFNITFL